MTRADIDFLKDLQHELLTQENDGNADPLYWGIMERKEVRVPDGEGSRTYFVMDGEKYTLEEFVASIDETVNVFDFNQDDGKFEETRLEWKQVSKTSYEEVNDFAEYTLNWDFYTVDVSEEDVLCHNTGAFLTKRAAQEYIRKFSYNHSQPRTWAMTAYRNFELEHLLKILKEIDIDQLKVDEE